MSQFTLKQQHLSMLNMSHVVKRACQEKRERAREEERAVEAGIIQGC